jgi:hypothetical protein
MEGDRILREVRRIVREHLTLSKAPLGQTSGDSTHRLHQLHVGDRPAGMRVDQRRFVTELPRTSKDKVAERHVRDLDVWNGLRIAISTSCL